MSLSGMLSLPWSPISSRPPELDVPLPRGLLRAAPVVGAVPGVAELAAGFPVTDPRPLGAPFSAKAADAHVEMFLDGLGTYLEPWRWGRACRLVPSD